MPRETIRRLSLDVERVLVAGAHLAAADSELGKDKQALESLAKQLGDKAPVIGQLAAATAKAISASGKEAARELVSLATMAAQVRSAQAQPAAAPKLEPLTPKPLVGTPCNAKDLDDVYEALVQKGKGRQEVIKEFCERGDIVDLRLVDALIFAMSDSWIGETVTTEAIPKLGPAIIKPIRDRLDLSKGRSVDGRRLRALVAVQRSEARDLLRTGLTEGNAEIREAALDAIADYVRGDPEFEPLVLATLEKEKTGGVRRAGLRALAGYASEKALEVLVSGLEDSRTLHAAAEGLGACKHPKVIDWMLTRLGEAVAETKVKKKPAKDAKGAKQGAKKGESYQVEPQRLALTLLTALARQQDPRIANAAMELLEQFTATAAMAVVNSGNKKQLERIADLLQGDEEDFFPAAAKATMKLGGEETFKRFTAAFKPNAKEKDKVLSARLAHIVSALRGFTPGDDGYLDDEREAKPLAIAKEARWVDFCLETVSDAPRTVALHVIPLIGVFKDKRAVKPLIKILQTEKNPSLVTATMRALGEIGDPAAIDPILAHSGTDWSTRWAMREAILAIDDVSAVDKVRTIFSKLKDPNGYKHWHMRSLLQQLEQRFPGK